MAAAYGLYTHIQANRVRSVLLLAGLFFLVYVLLYAGALMGEAFSQDAPLDVLLARALHDFWAGVPVVTIGAVIWIVIAYYGHQTLIDMVTGGRNVTRKEAPELYNTLENLCISRGIAMPGLKIMESDALNAFATGMNPKQYAITVTSGLLAALNKDELEAVLGHELTHIRNGDVRLLVIAVVIAGVVSFFGELVFRLLMNMSWGGGRGRSRGGEKGGGAIWAVLIAVVLIALSWLLSVVIRFSLSRSREYLADAGSVELTKNPDAMIAALRKIEGRGELRNAPSAVMEMCVDNPREDFSDLFATHPSVDKRVEALIKFAGGHDPGRLAAPAEDAPAQAGPWGEHSTEPAPPPADAGPWGRHQP
jgi:heat shock protein HtpX